MFKIILKDYIKRFLNNKIISEKAIGSYGIVKMLYIPSTCLVTSSIRVKLVSGCADVGVFIG
jgi:hypothetical protein